MLFFVERGDVFAKEKSKKHQTERSVKHTKQLDELCGERVEGART